MLHGDVDAFRVFVRRSNDPPGVKAVHVNVTSKTSFKKFLKAAGKKLGVKAVRCYATEGANAVREVTFIDEIKAEDEVIITDGELLSAADDGSGRGQETMFVSVLGAGGVGKSACALRFVRDFFVQDWDPTIEDAYRKTISVDGRFCTLELLDTAGQDDFESLRHQWMMDKHGYVFVYSVNSRRSLAELDPFFRLHEQINGRHSKIPIILVANKKDITDLDPKERQVSVQEGRRKAAEFGAIHIETSAATGEHVNDVFETLVRQVRQNQAPSKQPGIASRCCIL